MNGALLIGGEINPKSKKPRGKPERACFLRRALLQSMIAKEGPLAALPSERRRYRLEELLCHPSASIFERNANGSTAAVQSPARFRVDDVFPVPLQIGESGSKLHG